MAKNKKMGLGRGIEALFEDNNLEEAQTGENVVDLKLSAIRPNPYQPRRIFDQKALKELAKSISESGVFQPIIVRQPDSQSGTKLSLVYAVIDLLSWISSQRFPPLFGTLMMNG